MRKIGSECLQVFQVPVEKKKPLEIQLDREWLAILKATEDLLFLEKAPRIRKDTFRWKMCFFNIKFAE